MLIRILALTGVALFITSCAREPRDAAHRFLERGDREKDVTMPR